MFMVAPLGIGFVIIEAMGQLNVLEFEFELDFGNRVYFGAWGRRVPR